MSKGKMADSRRSTAAQFFMDEEEPAVEQKSTYDRVVELINQAIVPTKDCHRLQNLRQVQELIIQKEPNLLDNFLDEVLAFQSNKDADVRKFVVGFIEEACKKDPEILPKVVANLNIMLDDPSVAVQKRVIQASIQLYKVAFKWLCKSKMATGIMESVWAYLEQVKLRIISLLESDNDGVRTQAVKYMEMLVVVQTYPDQDSPKKGENDVALDDIPAGMKVLRPRKLEEEAKQIFESLVIFHGTPHISSVNLMACMQSLTLIARQRSEFMAKVIQALESLHANLPPTLAKSQVSSVRKHLKLQLLLLLKHPAAVDFQSQIATLLGDLGATQQEIMKNLPKPEELKKRSRMLDEGAPSSKRVKLEKEEEEEDVPPPPPPAASRSLTNTAIDITANDILPKLTPLNVTDLVLISMLALPPTMPAHFQASYTPISVAGTESQVKHLARLIATQLTTVGLGKGVEEMAANPPSETYEEEEEEEDESSPQQSISTVLGGTVSRDTKKEKTPLCLMPSGLTSKPRRMYLNLQEVTKPLDMPQVMAMVTGAVDRIMDSDKKVNLGSINQVRTKVLVSLASQFRGQISEMLRNYIFDDLRNRVDIALSWLFEEYVAYQGFNKNSINGAKSSVEHYDECLILLLEDLLQKADQKERDTLLMRFYLEAPCITENAISLLKTYCQEEATLENGLNTVKLMIEKRPPKQHTFLNILFDLTLHEKTEVRNQAVKVSKLLYERKDLQQSIEEFALKCLTHLLDPAPPEILVGEGKTGTKTWNEDYAKICLQLYLALLPLNHKLIHNLATVYVGTVADIKRTILRVLENPVKGMGMNSPEMLLLVENCPKGAETLVTRIIHILTDKAPPSAELVARVRDLYHKRVPDVRFLIPVLNGLTKKEVVAALPKLIKLNPIVVKEVFNRLLGSHAESGTTYTSPVTPAELLIALHNIDPSKCDMKTIIKATSLCFAEKQVYTQEVLAVVMQQLMELNPLPTLLMRTVIQSLSLYPRLIGFVMNILQRLILKQVWKQKKVWEGFIKCCQRTKPQSFQVLLQLPPPQLKNVFETCSDLRDPLLQHVNAFTEHQRAHLPQAIMDVLNGVEEKVAEEKGGGTSSLPATSDASDIESLHSQLQVGDSRIESMDDDDTKDGSYSPPYKKIIAEDGS